MENNDIRSMSVLLNACVNNMCNEKDSDTVTKEFVAAKDLLVNLFKVNVDRVSV